MTGNTPMTSPITTDDQRWDAVVGRVVQDQPDFLYAVKTTGVFCRPSCPSRPPNRENVVFFEDVEAAERAGYRACKRCKPNEATPRPVGLDAVVRACQWIDRAGRPPSLRELAWVVGLSPYHLHRLFKRTVGVTPKAYADSVRVRRFREGLARDGTVTGAIHGSGYGSSGRCYEAVGDTLGMTPTEFRNGGAGRSIRFAVAECRLGWVLVAATDRGVCLIEFADEPNPLRAGLSTRFPNANIEENDAPFRGWVVEVVRGIEAPALGFAAIPLDIQGTAFQRQVWEALRAIPLGQTATYTEVAQRIGKPNAVRAVASACASNTLGVVIPCHRVIREGGGLGGYRWGLDRKQKLLDIEAEGWERSGE